jgi:serine phosphatase RsbU (regulator of sigma subunit)
VTMAAVRNVTRALTLVTLDLANVLRYVDRFLLAHSLESFARAFFSLYDTRTRDLQSVLCGHPRRFLRVPPDSLDELRRDVLSRSGAFPLPELSCIPTLDAWS